MRIHTHAMLQRRTDTGKKHKYTPTELNRTKPNQTEPTVTCQTEFQSSSKRTEPNRTEPKSNQITNMNDASNIRTLKSSRHTRAHITLGLASSIQAKPAGRRTHTPTYLLVCPAMLRIFLHFTVSHIWTNPLVVPTPRCVPRCVHATDATGSRPRSHSFVTCFLRRCDQPAAVQGSNQARAPQEGEILIT